MDVETTAAQPPQLAEAVPLRDGERLTRAEFERRYEAMPDAKAELLNGVVHMTSPVSDDHGDPHSLLTGWLAVYRVFTPGVVSSSDGTLLLGDESEPQADVHLRIAETHGGQSRLNARRYVA